MALAAVAAVLGAGGAASGAAHREPARPNILFLLTDDQRAAGTMVEMDATRRIFGAGGTYFPNMYVTTPQCCPSRASFYSGQYAHNTGVRENTSVGGQPQYSNLDFNHTWPVWLNHAGYFTGFYGKLFNHFPPAAHPRGYDRWFIGTDPEHRYHNSESDSFLEGKAVNFLHQAESRDGTPWALAIGIHSPHLPNDPPRRYAHLRVPPYIRTPADRESDLSDKDPQIRRKALTERQAGRRAAPNRRTQLRMLNATDDLVAGVFRTMSRLGETRNTLAIFTSDNGYAWGEHGLVGKGSPYPESTRVPMFLRWPGHVAAGAVDRRLVANIDVAPTIYQATGVDPSYPVDGQSLLSPASRPWLLLEGPVRTKPDTISGWNAYQSLHTEYITYPDHHVEDYDLTQDPWHLRAHDVDRPRLDGLLARAERCAGTSCP